MWLWRILLVALVVLHLAVIFVNLAAFFLVPFMSCFFDIPFWFSVFITVPIQSIVVFLAFNRNPCPLTVWENAIREKLNLRKIGGFIGHYIIYMKWLRNKKKAEEHVPQEESLGLRTNA